MVVRYANFRTVLLVSVAFSGDVSPIFSHAIANFLRSKTVKTMNF